MGIEEIMPVSSVIYRRTFAEILAKQLVHAFDVLVPSWQDFDAKNPRLPSVETKLNSIQPLWLLPRF